MYGKENIENSLLPGLGEKQYSTYLRMMWSKPEVVPECRVPVPGGNNGAAGDMDAASSVFVKSVMVR